ncbi:MAG: hypothetical protein KBC74_02380 [Candidatus Pacebacteria bacterium]|nr:hypothetical protein [Candidatus Paceibacterota bacterium]MBP9832347.1 hypothetical protein [Candidatus Paceibacterota bacterium]
MKTYSKEERAEAKDKLPKPVRDFLSSNTITEIYDGLIKKNHLNLWQGSLMSKVANLTLLGLEPMSALETNLHQALPELSSATMREIVNDLNDRIFKEASRRLRENIMEPEPGWDAEEFGPKPQEGAEATRMPTDAELDALAEKEEIEGWVDPEEIAEAEAEKKRLATASVTLKEIVNTPSVSIVAEKLGLVADASPETKKTETDIPVTPISEEKLEGVTTDSTPSATQNPTSIKPQVSEAPKPAYKGGVDPYREPVE